MPGINEQIPQLTKEEAENIEEGNRLRKIAEEAMKSDKAASPEEKIEEKK